ncbi:MAG: HDOD domain-containing protein [Halothiobacillaceae bacterium]|nr:MAG: HDOD domain-containing protein [Halothiobacillaceae bacterium]
MSWAERLAAKPLPALGETHSRLSRLLGREDTSNWPLEVVIRRDPALTLLILGDVNRQARRFGRDDVTTYDSAIGLLGRERLKTLVRAAPASCFSLLDPLPKEGLRLTLARALEAAQQAESWALARREPVAEQHYHAAILAYTPELALWHEAPELAARAHQATIQQGIGMHEALGMVLQEDWNRIRLGLVKHWGLPSLLGEAWSEAETPSTPARGIRLACDLMDEGVRGWHTVRIKALRPAIAEYLGLDEAAAWLRCQRTAVLGATGLHALGLRPSAHTLVASDETPWPLDAPLAPPEPARPGPVDILRGALAGVQGSNALLQQLLKHLRGELGLNRMVLLMLDGEKSRLEARFAVGIPADDPLRSLILSLNSSDLFSALLKKHQPLWMNASNRPAFIPRLPAEARGVLATTDMFITPLQINHEAVGLLLAQRSMDAEPLSADDFRLFNALKSVAHEALNPAP